MMGDDVTIMNYYVISASTKPHDSSIKLCYTELKYINRKKKFLWWNYTRRDVINAPFHIWIPVLLYLDGNEVREYFTKEFFGQLKEEGYLNRDGYSYKGIYVEHRYHHLVCTDFIQEYSALDFLSVLKEVRAAAANVGLTEQDIKDQIASQFAESRRQYQEEQNERIRALENEKREEAALAHREQQAREYLERNIRE